MNSVINGWVEDKNIHYIRIVVRKLVDDDSRKPRGQ